MSRELDLQHEGILRASLTNQLQRCNSHIDNRDSSLSLVVSETLASSMRQRYEVLSKRKILPVAYVDYEVFKVVREKGGRHHLVGEGDDGRSEQR